MSRIGNEIITLPAGVTVDIKDNVITVKGPKGTLSQSYDPVITPNLNGNVLHFTRANNQGDVKAKHGLYRALTMNMVGWKVAKQGKKIVLNVGFSHPVDVEEIEGITLDCPSATEITVSGISKEKVGQFAAMVRGIREPEPYHGYGIRYSDEVIERKVGKAAGGKG